MGKPYTVFIDESFDGFMNLSRDDGYFCYAALMVPTGRLSDLDRFWAANRDRLAGEYQRATGFPLQGEFKSGYMNKLAFPTRRKFGERLAYFLRKNDCFVAGFYTTVRNMLAYHLRTEVAKDDDAKDLPANWESGTTLILPVPQGHEPVVMTLKGMRLKWGDRRPMSDALRQKLGSPLPNSMLPLCFDRLAGTKLSCEAVFGESRVLNFGIRCFEDMTD